MHPLFNYAILFIFLFLIFSCQKNTKADHPVSSDINDVIGFQDNLSHAIYVVDKYEATALSALGIQYLNGGLTSSVIQLDSFTIDTVPVTGVLLAIDDYITTFSLSNTAEGFPIKRKDPQESKVVRKNSRCDLEMPAYSSKCIRTYGHHRRYGPYMTRASDPYYFCGSGDTICVTNLRTVGTTYYYIDKDCTLIDTVYVSRPIRRWSCDEV